MAGRMRHPPSTAEPTIAMSAPLTRLHLLQRIDDAYRHYRGQPLAEGLYQGPEAQRLRWIDEQAPFALLAHDASADPRFIYVNAAARGAFGYSKEAFIGLPSRLSAGPDAQEDRDAILAAVKQHGYASGYGGIRLTRDGQAFRIVNGELWQLQDAQGQALGQAALVWRAE